MQAAVENMHPSSNLHAYISKEETAGQLKGLLMSDGLQ